LVTCKQMQIGEVASGELVETRVLAQTC